MESGTSSTIQTLGSDLPSSAADARAVGAKRYFTGKACKNGHVCERITDRSVCVQCLLWHVKARRKNNPEKCLSERRAYYAKNSERLIEKALERYRAADRDHVRNLASQWRNKNRGRYRHLSYKRMRRLADATPSWVDLSDIQDVYDEARRLEVETGVAHDVDHIVPLQGKFVCGLNVPWNLRPLTSAENQSKGNRMPPESECVGPVVTR